ncbi:MAG: hypothetical protein R6X32_12575 [Chloroflexota bacterium]
MSNETPIEPDEAFLDWADEDVLANLVIEIISSEGIDRDRGNKYLEYVVA